MTGEEGQEQEGQEQEGQEQEGQEQEGQEQNLPSVDELVQRVVDRIKPLISGAGKPPRSPARPSPRPTAAATEDRIEEMVRAALSKLGPSPEGGGSAGSATGEPPRPPQRRRGLAGLIFGLGEDD